MTVLDHAAPKPRRMVAPTGSAVRTMATPVGDLLVAATARGVALVLWPDDTLEVAGGHDPGEGADALADDAVRQLREWFGGARVAFELPLDPAGTEFQRQVWDRLAEVRFGETSTYGRLATAVGRPSGARAVGAAVGRNPISIIVPCHRVVGANGHLTGFAAGLPIKTWLLRHEGVTLT